jgi:small subunit ribosomal protein S6
MREYELMFIVHPELDEEAFNEIVTRISSWITDDGGEILKTDIWGKRPLAYPIRKLSEGQYVLMKLKMNANFGVTFERNMRYLEPVLRYLLTVL